MDGAADVVIIGGGVIGLSVAYHLAERGARDIVVLEAGRCGGGSTLKATGGIRHQFGTAINVRCSLLALPFWRRFDETFGARANFREIGYLFLQATPEQIAAAERNVAMQAALGVPARLMTTEEATQLAPGLNPDGVLAATFCPWDGAIEVAEVVAGLLNGCRRRGVDVREGARVTGVTLAGGRVQGVTTTGGPLAAPVVVNAAGPWAAEVGALAGVELPVRPERRQAAVTAPTGGIDPRAAWTIDLGSGCYARPDLGGGAVIGGGDRGAAADRPLTELDEAGLARMRELVGRRFPGLDGAPLARAWVGLRPMSPDDHAILGATEVDGFLVAGGLGSHGLMHAPAVGQLLSELIVDGAAHTIDIAPLSPARFARGELLTESVQF
jgi:sarcosine oxidase, subunit beta